MKCLVVTAAAVVALTSACAGSGSAVSAAGSPSAPSSELASVLRPPPEADAALPAPAPPTRVSLGQPFAQPLMFNDRAGRDDAVQVTLAAVPACTRSLTGPYGDRYTTTTVTAPAGKLYCMARFDVLNTARYSGGWNALDALLETSIGEFASERELTSHANHLDRSKHNAAFGELGPQDRGITRVIWQVAAHADRREVRFEPAYVDTESVLPAVLVDLEP